MASLILDSDVLLNWLLQEEETRTATPLWVAPAIILELGEKRAVANRVSLLSMMEVRFVLRRKKKWSMETVEADLRAMQRKRIVDIVVPQSRDLEQAERLQSEERLDPFDSIILSQAISGQSRLVTRDAALIGIARKYVSACTPEDYIKQCMDR